MAPMNTLRTKFCILLTLHYFLYLTCPVFLLSPHSPSLAPLLMHTCSFLSLARKNPSQALVVEEVCCPANKNPISIPMISLLLTGRPSLMSTRNHNTYQQHTRWIINLPLCTVLKKKKKLTALLYDTPA